MNMVMYKSNLKSKLLAGCSVSAIALMTSIPNVATAQQPEENQVVEEAQPKEILVVEEVLITALKRETSIMEAPVAITVLTGDFLREVNLNDVKDLILWTPGITGNSQDSFIDAVSVRGILTNDFGVGGDPSVGFFKNNLYQGRNGVVISSLYDMDRAEVLRGPQGFLFGRNAIGGAISVFTKRPELNSNSGYAEFDIGQRNHYVAEGAVNISNSNRFGVRLAGYYSREDGWVDNVARPADPRLLGHEKFAFRASALYEDEKFTALLTVEYEDRDQDGTAYRAIEESTTFQRLKDLFGTPSNQLFGGTIRGNGRDVDQDLGFGGIEDKGEIFSLGFHLDWDLGWATLTSITGYTDHDWLYIEDFDGTPLQLNDYKQDQKGNYFQQELRLTSTTDGPLSWYAGASFYKENIDATFTDKSNEGLMYAYYGAPYYEGYPYYYDPATAAYYALYYGQTYYGDPLDGELIEVNQAIGHYKGWAAYVNLNYAFNDKFDIGVGVRYTKDTKEFSLEAFPVDSVLGPFFTLGFTTDGPLTAKRSWSAFTPQFIARFRPNDNWMMFASATRGFKSGGFGSFNIEPDLLGVDITQAQASPSDFEPEKVWSYEIGIKGTLAGGKVLLDANAYLYKYKDLQLTVAGAGGGIVVDNVGRVTGYGFEGSLQWQVNEYVYVRIAGARTSTELREAQDICPGEDPDACEGRGLGYVPDWSGSAIIGGQYPVAGGQIRGWAEFFGQTETGGIPISTDPAEKIGAYVDVSLRFGYESDNGWSIIGYVENVTNSLYYDGIFPGEGILPGVWFNPSRPRTFGVRFSASFGRNR